MHGQQRTTPTQNFILSFFPIALCPFFTSFGNNTLLNFLSQVYRRVGPRPSSKGWTYLALVMHCLVDAMALLGTFYLFSSSAI